MLADMQELEFDYEEDFSWGLMITGRQIRAGRGLLGWSTDDLAERAGVSYSTVQRAEKIDGVSTMRASNLLAIQRAMELGDGKGPGVIFQTAGENRPGGDGVRLRTILRRPTS
jgi:transcriptional regulator with XRE-family HTH domain